MKAKSQKNYYSSTKDGIYTPEGKYVKIWWWWNKKDIQYGDPLHVHSASYTGDLSFLETETDKLTNNSEPMIDYFEKDYIKVTKTNPLYNIVFSGWLKKISYDISRTAKKNLKNAESLMKKLESCSNIVKNPVSYSLKLLEATKDYAAKKKLYEEAIISSKVYKDEAKELEKKYIESLKN